MSSSYKLSWSSDVANPTEPIYFTKLAMAEDVQIIIPDEMIAAGIQALPFMDSDAIGSISEGTLVCRVFEAMDRVRREHDCPQMRRMPPADWVLKFRDGHLIVGAYLKRRLGYDNIYDLRWLKIPLSSLPKEFDGLNNLKAAIAEAVDFAVTSELKAAAQGAKSA